MAPLFYFALLAPPIVMASPPTMAHHPYLSSLNFENIHNPTKPAPSPLDFSPFTHFNLRTRDSIPSATVPLTPPWKFPIWGGVIGALLVLLLCVLCAFICSGLNRRQNQRKDAKLRKVALEDGRLLVKIKSVSAQERAIIDGEAMHGNQTNANWNLDGALDRGNGDGDGLQRPKNALVKGRLPPRVQFQGTSSEISVAEPNTGASVATSSSHIHTPIRRPDILHKNNEGKS